MRIRRSPFLLAALGFLLAVPASGADQAKARKKLDAGGRADGFGETARPGPFEQG